MKANWKTAILKSTWGQDLITKSDSIKMGIKINNWQYWRNINSKGIVKVYRHICQHLTECLTEGTQAIKEFTSYLHEVSLPSIQGNNWGIVWRQNLPQQSECLTEGRAGSKVRWWELNLHQKNSLLLPRFSSGRVKYAEGSW